MIPARKTSITRILIESFRKIIDFLANWSINSTRRRKVGQGLIRARIRLRCLLESPTRRLIEWSLHWGRQVLSGNWSVRLRLWKLGRKSNQIQEERSLITWMKSNLTIWAALCIEWRIPRLKKRRRWSKDRRTHLSSITTPMQYEGSLREPIICPNTEIQSQSKRRKSTNRKSTKTSTSCWER